MTARAFAALLLTAGLACPGSAQEAASSLGEAIAEGDVSGSLRYRFEVVEDNAFDDAGRASTLRTFVAYETRRLHGFAARLQFGNVVDLGASPLHADAAAGGLGNGVTDRPVVADPELTRVNQASLSFEQGGTRIEAGRLAITLDDERFVGPVGWRQNLQTFAAARVVNRSIRRTTLSYTFLERAYTITGAERPMASHLANVSVELPLGTAVAYGYLLDFDREVDAGLSTSTVGLRLSGSRRAGALTLHYQGVFARQHDAGSNPQRVRASYYRVQAGAGTPRLTAELGYEVLTGSEEDGRFTTPLATLHAFNGWADKFLVTPPAGLGDASLTLRGVAGAFSWRAALHDFSAEDGPMDYGREIDLLVTWKSSWGPLFGAKAARYEADELSSDTTKLWLWSAYSF